VAKTIGTVSGVALAPGVSRNGRRYTREAIGRAVARAQERIAAGKRPIGMYTDHDTRKVTDMAGAVTKIWQEADGSAHYVGALADTPAGKKVASLVDPAGDVPAFLRGVSIKGNWLGRVRHERGPAGDPVETADDLEISRLDFTGEPGVDDAGVSGFKAADDDGGEARETWTISESAPEALVETAITEEAAPPVPAVPVVAEADREALRAILGIPAGLELEEAGTPAMSKRDSGLSGSGRAWADPGYQADHKQRYDITTKDLAKTAWSYINQESKAAKYTPAQLKRVKARIVKALRSFGVTVSTAEAAGWMFDQPFQVGEPVLEWIGGTEAGSRAGSWCINASNGPVSLSLSSYCMDPADLDVILRAAADAACKALAALDPDMDGDVDVPGVGDGSDADDDAPAESAQPAQVTETSPPDPAPEPAAAAPTSKEGSAVSETTTQEAAPAPAAAPDPKVIQEAVDAALAKADADRRARKAAKKAAAGKAAEAAPAAQVTETDDERIARLVEERAAARLKAEGAPVAETEEQRIERLVEARVTAEKQRLVAEGQVVPGRKGLTSSGEVNEHTARVTSPEGEMPPAPPGKSWDEMHKWSTEELNQYATPGLADYVFRGRAGRIG
jgi:hypothetical protein